MERKKKGKAAYMISAVAETYDIHPQTLRLYEREGLLKPSRSEGNTRLYTQEDLERLELILNLTRDLGVNLAGVEVILNMRQRVEEMQREMQEFVEYVEREFTNRSPELAQKIHNALVKVTPPHVTLARPRKEERKHNL
jgi:MerR family transcriptional regulator/heat shock protein HspR